MGTLRLICFSLSFCLLVKCEGSRRPVLFKPPGSAGTGCYFIVLKDKTPEDEMQQLMTSISKLADDSRIHAVVNKISKAFTVKLSPYALEMVRRMPGVAYIEEEGFAVGTQNSPGWHLDRLDQLLPTLDQRYSPIGDGAGVDVYILDSGINYDHEEFEYRAKYAGLDPTDEYDAEESDGEPLVRQYGRDCHGHGTHVASLCGGRTYGSAKKATLYSIRVLGCNNAGPWSVVLSGLEHAVTMAEQTNRPSLLSMSFSGDHYYVVNDAVRNAMDRGVHAIMAAGNGGSDACSRSPASTVGGISVGGTRQGDGLYLVGSGTNFGPCVTIFAPGERVMGAEYQCRNCSKFLSGTSMSTPIVSGLAAIVLSREPLLSPEKLRSRLIEMSVKDAISYTGMPEEFRTVTPNRLINIQGSCGERDSPDGHASIASPDFPGNYPPNLDCRWEIGGKGQIRINISITFVKLEIYHDVLRVYDGCCENHSSLLKEFTGDLGHVDYTVTSSTNLLCVQLLTDGTVSAAGFNATYTKIYEGTDLRVPNPEPPPPLSPQGNTDVEVVLSMSPRQTRDRVETLMGEGYKLTWISSYRVGPDMKPYFDFVATNNSAIDTVSYVEIRFDELNQTIHGMREKGYFVRLLIDRIRGKNPSPSYSVIFEPRNSIFETQVYLRDSFEAYTVRLNVMTQAGFRLLSQSFCSIRGTVETTSVYVRDKRIPLNIPAPEYSTLVVRNNLTFFEFTTATLQLATDGYYPFAVEVFTQGSRSDSYFSAIYEERGQNSQGNWFRWSLNTTAARDMIAKETQHTWDVYLTVGYTYLGNSEHFIEFKRKNT